MALCETCCGQPVLSDGQRCDTCRVIGRERELPRGFVAYGWHTFASGGLSSVARLSVAHLTPERQVRLVRGGTQAVADGPALCGITKRGRYAQHDSPGMVFGEARRGERKWCERCFVAAALDGIHVPTFRTHRTGVGNAYGRGRSGSGGQNTHVTCSCGWTNTSNTTKREQERNFREHVQDAVRYGLFVVEEERYAPRVVSLHGAASAVNAVGTITDETMRMLRTLVFGDEVVGSSRRERMVTVRRKAMPLIPVRSTDPS
jgi:hypothetical protein